MLQNMPQKRNLISQCFLCYCLLAITFGGVLLQVTDPNALKPFILRE